MKPILAPIENLIIDLGGVLYEIDPALSVSAFAGFLGGGKENEARILQVMGETQLWQAHEKGELSDAQFRDGIRDALGISVSDESIDEAWNRLLIRPIQGRTDLLLQLKQRYRLVLLSNTNHIHFKHLSQFAQPVLDCFERCFLSFEMGCSKPGTLIFEQTLREMNWTTGNCLFIDDSHLNCSGAEKLGLKSVWVEADGAQAFADLAVDLMT